MTDEKDVLPSDAEKGSLKARDPKDSDQPAPPPTEDKKAENDPSEQPS